MMGNGSGMGGMWGFWMLGLLALTVVVLLVVLAERTRGGGTSRGKPDTRDRSPARSRAQETLDERFARGELSTEEYRERLLTLREG